MLIVLDTNVLVSSILKHNSKPALIMNAVLEGKIQIAIDERIFNEYTNVLHRPKLNIPADKADAIRRFIAISALWVQSQPVEFQQELVNDPGQKRQLFSLFGRSTAGFRGFLAFFLHESRVS
jgi:putative PIN family toxin of toxin-antitoxin system